MLEHLSIGFSTHVIAQATWINRVSSAQIEFALRLLNSANPKCLTHITLGLRISHIRITRPLQTVLFGEWSTLEKAIGKFPALVSVKILTSGSFDDFPLQDFGDRLEPVYVDFLKHEFRSLDARGILQFA